MWPSTSGKKRSSAVPELTADGSGAGGGGADGSGGDPQAAIAAAAISETSRTR
jgi:hypothetical protein